MIIASETAVLSFLACPIEFENSYMQLEKHFTILIYPFRHNITPSNRRLRLQRLNGRWKPWWQRFEDNKAFADALDDTRFFLPYVRGLLFPETAKLHEADADWQLEKARALAHEPLEELAQGLLEDGVLRFTYDPLQLQSLQPLRLEFERDNFSAPFQLHWIDVALFPQSVGFLVLKVELDEIAPSTNRVIDFLYYLRLIHPPKTDWALANWRCTSIERPLVFKSRDLVDYLLQGLTSGSSHLEATLAVFLTRVRHGDPVWRYSTTELGQVYGSVFRKFSYACLAEARDNPDQSSSSQYSEDSVQAVAHTSKSAGHEQLFNSYQEQVLYELATVTQITEPNYEPHPHSVKQLMENGHIALWANWQGLALHDNVIFLGIKPTRFVLEVLAQNVESDYFHLFLITLYQKVRLSWMSGDAMQRGADLHRNLAEARAQWDAFTAFRNHYWFAEVTAKPQGIELYKRFHKGMMIQTLYQCISDEMIQLQEYYERKTQRRTDVILFFLAAIGLPASLLAEFFGSALIKDSTWDQFGWTALIVFGVFFIVGFIWWQTARDILRPVVERVRRLFERDR